MSPDWPEGFRYEPEFVGEVEERELAEAVAALDFAEVRMRGVVARRRTAHFGWRYGYESWRIEPGPALPGFLVPLRARAAALAGVAPDELAETLVTEYRPGAGIGWHRDAPMFGVVIGVSLLGGCRLRFQRVAEGARQTRVALLQPRSAYLLTGPARSQWQHGIPRSTSLRYSITYRTLRRGRAAARQATA